MKHADKSIEVCYSLAMTGEAGSPNNEFKPYRVALDVGFSIAVPIVLFAVIGRVLDNQFGTSPLFIIGAVLISMAISSMIIWKKMKPFL